MSTVLQWNGKSCEVTAKKIYRPEAISTGLKGKRNDLTNLPEGTELRSASFELKLGIAAGVKDPLAEISWWEGKVGKSDTMLLGGKRFPNKKKFRWILDSVGQELSLNASGTVYEAVVTLSFSEKPSKKSVIASIKADAKQKKSSADKKQKKKINKQMKKAISKARKRYKKI